MEVHPEGEFVDLKDIESKLSTDFSKGKGSAKRSPFGVSPRSWPRPWSLSQQKSP
jgi:hypothetical protein